MSAGKYFTGIKNDNIHKAGYYLVHSSGRYFISSKVSEPALNRVCNKILTDTDYDYWIDYSLGLDVAGNPAWINVDQSNLFL